MNTYELSVFITSEKEQDIHALIMKVMEALHDGEKEIVISPIELPTPERCDATGSPSTTTADPTINPLLY